MSTEESLKAVMSKVMEGSSLKARMAMCLFEISRNVQRSSDKGDSYYRIQISDYGEMGRLLEQAEALATEAFKEIGSRL